MNSVDVIEHETVVASGHDLATGQRVFRAECSCGWTSEWTDDPADADDAVWHHAEVLW